MISWKRRIQYEKGNKEKKRGGIQKVREKITRNGDFANDINLGPDKSEQVRK